MKTANLVHLELKNALGRPKAALMRLGLAFLIGSPLALARMPLEIRAAGLTMVVVFISFFGAAVASARASTSGQRDLLAGLPLPGWLTALDKILAGAFIDLLQIAPLLILAWALAGPGFEPRSVLNALGAAILIPALLNALGLGLGRVLKSNAEVHLAGALCVGLLAFTAGLFPVPESLAGLVGITAHINPLAWLKTGLTLSLGQAGAWVGWDWAVLVPALVLVCLFCLRALNYRPGKVKTNG